MSRLSPVSWRELVRRLQKLGYEGPYPGKKHPYMVKDDVVIILPNPHSWSRHKRKAVIASP